MDGPGCCAMTKFGHGSHVAAIETTSTYDPDGDCLVVAPSTRARGRSTSQRRQRRTACNSLRPALGERGVPWRARGLGSHPRGERGLASGVRIGDCGVKRGLNRVDNGWIEFRDATVPRANLLSRYAEVDSIGHRSRSILDPNKRFFTTLGALVTGRVSIALAALSAAKAGLSIAIQYGGERRQFGPPCRSECRILDYLSHQRRLLPHLATAYALDVTLTAVSDRLAAADDPRRQENEALIAGLRAYSTWFAREALQQSRDCCGGKGYLAASQIAPPRARTQRSLSHSRATIRCSCS